MECVHTLVAGLCGAAMACVAPAQSLEMVSGRYLSQGVAYDWRGFQPVGTGDLPLFVWPQRPGFSGWTPGQWNHDNMRWLASRFNCVAVVVEFDNTGMLAPPVSLQSVFDHNMTIARAVYARWDPDSALRRIAAATRFDPGQGCFASGNSQGATTSLLGLLVNPIDVRACATMGVGVHIDGQGINNLCSHALFGFNGVDVLALEYDHHRIWRVRTMVAEDDFVYVGTGPRPVRNERARFTMAAMTGYTALNADGTGAVVIPEGFGNEGHNPQLSPRWPTSPLPYGRTAVWTWLMTYVPPVTYHGSAVAGTGGRRPAVTTGSKPAVGNVQFSIDVLNALPGAACLLLLGSSPASVPILGHVVQTNADLGAVSLVADTDGRASLPLPLPARQGLVGFALQAQVFVADPGGIAGLSSGHRTRIEIVPPD